MSDGGAAPDAGGVSALSGSDDAAGEAGALVVGVRDREHRFPGRGRRVTVRLGEEEHAEIVLEAARAGLTTAGFVGAVAVAAASGMAPPVVSESRLAVGELMAARLQLRRFGVNVNQAVAAVNASGGVVPEWLGQAVGLASRAVLRVDEAAEVLMRRRR